MCNEISKFDFQPDSPLFYEPQESTLPHSLPGKLSGGLGREGKGRGGSPYLHSLCFLQDEWDDNTTIICFCTYVHCLDMGTLDI